MTEEKSPDGRQPHEPGAKLDAGKPLVVKGFIEYFPNAITYVSGVLAEKTGTRVESIFRGMGNVFASWLIAIEQIAQVSEIGANKYCWKGWQQVDNANDRYTEALGRHEIKRHHDPIDHEYGTLHAAHAAWNAWAILELLITVDDGANDAISAAAEHVIASMDILEGHFTRCACPMTGEV